MTYLQFLLVFLAPPIAALLLVSARSGRPGWREARALLLVCAAALVYTTPWDNYLVRRGVWGYGEERVVGTIGYVPVEEYLFFLLQPLLTGLFYLRVRRFEATDADAAAGGAWRWGGAALWLGLAGAGATLLGTERGTYLGLILVWAGPVLAGQWALGAGRIRAQRRAAVIGVLAPTVYFWVADRIAIGLGIWSIAPALSTGLLPLGLPVEEAVFFLATDLLVVHGLILLAPLPGASSHGAVVADHSTGASARP